MIGKMYLIQSKSIRCEQNKKSLTEEVMFELRVEG